MWMYCTVAKLDDRIVSHEHYIYDLCDTITEHSKVAVILTKELACGRIGFLLFSDSVIFESRCKPKEPEHHINTCPNIKKYKTLP